MPKPYSLPLEQLWISSGTGYRQDPLGGVDAEEKLHDGIDLAAREGTPVYAVMSGVVVTHYVPPDGKKWKGHPVYGGMLEIESEPGLLWRFGHLKTTLVHEDDFVKQGQKIGLVGSTGMSTAPHLHLQVIVSPMKYLEERR
jgi:murein DD-endopeptidase MepM/ murein hydrolase activator NlpD